MSSGGIVDNKNKEILHNYVTKKQSSQPNSCQWIPVSSSIVTVGKKVTGGIAKGDIKIHKLEFQDGDDNYDSKLNLAYENESITPFRCMSFFKESTQEQRNFVTGDFNGGIAVWDSDICDIPIWSVKEAQQGCIAAIDAYGDNMIVCGGKDGTIKVYDKRTTNNTNPTSKFEQTIKNNCWSICSNDNKILTGFENGDLIIYNLKTNSIESTIKINQDNSNKDNIGGICSIDSNNRSNLLNQILVTTNKSMISLISLNNNTNKFDFNNHIINNDNPSLTIWSGNFSPFNNKNNNNNNSKENIYTISQGDGIVSMYKDQNILIDKAVVSDSAIISLDYNKDRKGLLCCISLKKQLSVLITPYE